MGSMPEGLNLLLVDDDPSEFIFLEDALDATEAAHTLAYAETGREALDRLETGARPDIMILDLRMPEMSGFEVLGAVRAKPGLNAMAIYIVSNTMIEADHKRALAMGAQGYHVKPLTPDGYEALVEALCSAARPHA